MADDLGDLRAAYLSTKRACRTSWTSDVTGAAIRSFVDRSLTFLRNGCSSVELVSRVPGKTYRGFHRNNADGVISRPANRDYFLPDAERMNRLWGKWNRGRLSGLTARRFLYTAALAPCLALELFDRQNKKGPATYFECFVGHVIARTVGAVPRRNAILPVDTRTVRMTMDFIFDLDKTRSLHLAVKMSTRERIVQAWAHQRLLDGAFGPGRYRGLMVLFGVTKLDSRSHEVVEICVPDQWLAYQSLLARMDRIYYFDPPARYLQLAEQFPALVQLCPFADFFSERGSVLDL